MNVNINNAVELAAELGNIFNILVSKSEDLDLRRLFKQIEADMMDIRHKLSLASKIISNKS